MKVVLKIAVLIGGVVSFAPAAMAEMGPSLLIETGPSDNPSYRRMVFVKYLSGSSVTANYKAYNRREFINVPNLTDHNAVLACASGVSTPLSVIRGFEREEKRLARSGKKPVTRTFCIKNVPNWTAQNKDKYLDPIFDSMPYVAK